MSVRCLHKDRQLLAEGPLWVAAEAALYWVDIRAGRLHRLSLSTAMQADDHRYWDIDGGITSINLSAGGGFVITTERGFARLPGTDAHLEAIQEVEPQHPGNRFNDAKVDPEGVLWAGTMDDAEIAETGALYRLDRCGNWTVADTGYVITNGPTFSPDGSTLYHTDTLNRTIFAFDLDRFGVHGRRPFLRFEPEDGYPDGMTVDAEGCLWVCQYGGWGVTRFSPSGERLEKIDLPVANVTSACFAGAELDQLVLTTAAKNLDRAALETQPLAGSLFVCEPGVQGLPAGLYGG